MSGKWIAALLVIVAAGVVVFLIVKGSGEGLPGMSEELVREIIRESTGQDVDDELMSTVLEVKSQIEHEYDGQFKDYTELSDLYKGQRAWWLAERAFDLVHERHRQLMQRREQMIAQEMGLNGTVPQPTQYQQQPVQQPQTVVPIWCLFAGIAGSIVLGYALSLLRSQGSEEDDDGRDE